MSKRTLFIIIGLLSLLDLATFFIYFVGHSNSDGKSPIEYVLRDSLAVEMADTIPDALVTDVYDTIYRSVNYVSRDFMTVGRARKPMTCTVKLKMLWPKSVNNNTGLKDLHNELLALIGAPKGTTGTDAADFILGKPEFAKPSNSFVRSSSSVAGKGGIHTLQQYRVFPYICTNYLLEMVVVVEKHDGMTLARSMSIVHYDRQRHELLPINKILDMEKSDSILALVNQNIESLKMLGNHDNWHETTILPTQFLLGKKSVIFYLHDGAIAPQGAGIHEISVPNKDMESFFTNSYREMLNNDTHFKTYDFLMP